ncbi:hypothetical protein D3C87_1528990 [compost metagenome]
MDLHVHLNRGNTLFGTSDLEVHVTSEVFRVGDVAHDIWRIAVHHETHSNTRHWSLERYTGVHERKYRATRSSH